MTQRFSVRTVFSAHWKGLTNVAEDDAPPEPDNIARTILVMVPLVAGVTVGGAQIPLSSPGVIVAALSLLTGSLLTVFTQLSTLRLKLTEWHETEDKAHKVDKDAIDESVAHVLTATLLALAATFVAVAATVVGDQNLPVLKGIVAGVVVALVAYVVLLLIMLVPRLYGAYVAVHDVDPALDGQVDDRRNRPTRRLHSDD